MWKVKPGATPGTLSVAGLGWEPVTTSNGVSQAGTTPANIGGATAADFGNLAGRVRAEEMLRAVANPDDPVQGELKHAITITVECIDGTYIAPALHTGLPCDPGSGPAPAMGARFRLSPSLHIDPAWAPWQKVLIRTLQDYGMYVNDTGTGPDAILALQKESGSQYQAENVPNPWSILSTNTTDFSGPCLPGWNTYNGCAGHFNVDSSNPVPVSIWTQYLQLVYLAATPTQRSGPTAGGQPLTLTGSGLTGTVNVSFGSTTVTGTGAADGSSVTVTTPLHTAGPVDLTVTAGGHTAVLASGYTFATPPRPAAGARPRRHHVAVRPPAGVRRDHEQHAGDDHTNPLH